MRVSGQDHKKEKDFFEQYSESTEQLGGRRELFNNKVWGDSPQE